MDHFFISGIQQVGIGTENFRESWNWYIRFFGMDIKILEDDTIAERMLPYTGGKPQKRHACIAINVQGGGGFEIWQYFERQPQPLKNPLRLGDLGINIAKIKCTNIINFHKHVLQLSDQCTKIYRLPDGKRCFYIKDLYNNIFQAVEQKDKFIDCHISNGGVIGAIIGVSDMDRSIPFYADVLGYDTVIYDKTGVFDDWQGLNGGKEQYRRVLLAKLGHQKGAFADLFGESVIELVQSVDRQPEKIYAGRQWGDPGFIQLCFDITGMDALGEFCAAKGHPFTVDSCPNNERFDMGDASGRFTYIEDPDGTLIEFVETYKIPIVKKINWFIDLTKRDRTKVLPKILFRLMRLFSKEKIK